MLEELEKLREYYEENKMLQEVLNNTFHATLDLNNADIDHSINFEKND